MADSPLHSATIVHASVLNPVRHPRILYRQARTQAAAGYSVAIVANGSDATIRHSEEAGVALIALPRLARQAGRRLFRPWRVMRSVYALQPRLVHLHTPELLLPAIALRPPNCQLVYDVHEDYAHNVRQPGAWPSLVRGPLAGTVRRLERWAVPHLAAVTYAEEAYCNLLGAPSDRVWVLANRFAAPPSWPEPLPPLQDPVLLYTGTLAHAWGLGDTLALWDGLNRHRAVHLVVAASGDEPVWQAPSVQQQLARWPTRWTRLGESGFVPHSLIWAWIQRATFGTALYQPLPHLVAKRPSKFYEFMAAGTPLIFRQVSAWRTWNESLQFGVGIDKVDDEAIQIVLQAIESGFPTVRRHTHATEWSWAEREAPQLLAMTERLIGPPPSSGTSAAQA